MSYWTHQFDSSAMPIRKKACHDIEREQDQKQLYYQTSTHTVTLLWRDRSRESEKMGERDIDDLPKNNANYTALTPLGFLERAALVHPNRTSIVHGSLSYTWLQTYQRCRRLASALAKRSISSGSTVPCLFILVISESSLCDFCVDYVCYRII